MATELVRQILPSVHPITSLVRPTLRWKWDEQTDNWNVTYPGIPRVILIIISHYIECLGEGESKQATNLPPPNIIERMLDQ